MENIRELVSKNIKLLRAFNGISAADLAFKAELKSKNRVSDIEEGRVSATVDDLVGICMVLNVSISDLTSKKIKVVFE